MKSYPQIPNLFDGDLPPVGRGQRERIKIGHKYDFEGTGIAGEVTTATVVENEKKIYIGVNGMDGKSHILIEDMSDAELDVYRKYPDTYFGTVQPAGKQINDPYEFFEWALSIYCKTSKERLLEFMKDASDIETLQTLDQKELALEYCERMTHAAMSQQSRNSIPVQPH